MVSRYLSVKKECEVWQRDGHLRPLVIPCKEFVNGFKVSVREEGMRGLAKGWAPTAIGYSMQGICKFGFYEVFKNLYGNLIGEENAYLYRTSLYLAASASAEFFADIALAPMEATKVRIQTQPVGTFPTTLRGAVPK